MRRDDEPVQLGRLAMRLEGDYWNAYYATPGTMKDAILLGSVKMQFVIGNHENQMQRKEQFMQTMRDCVADIIEEATGSRPTWGGPRTAPEHERSGRA